MSTNPPSTFDNRPVKPKHRQPQRSYVERIAGDPDLAQVVQVVEVVAITSFHHDFRENVGLDGIQCLFGQRDKIMIIVRKEVDRKQTIWVF